MLLNAICIAGMILTLKDTGVPECVLSGPPQLVRKYKIRPTALCKNSMQTQTFCLPSFPCFRRTICMPSSPSLAHWRTSSCVWLIFFRVILFYFVIIGGIFHDTMSSQPSGRTLKSHTKMKPWQCIKYQYLVNSNSFLKITLRLILVFWKFSDY